MNWNTAVRPQIVYFLKAHDVGYPKSDKNTNINTNTETNKWKTWYTYDVIYFWKGDDKRILNVICDRQSLRKNNTKTNTKTNTRTTDRPMMLYVFGKEMTKGVWLWRMCWICRIFRKSFFTSPWNISTFYFSVLHLLNQNVIKSKVQCPHSISRTCLAQEFGLVCFDLLAYL